jgi:hypothetical protein
MYHPPPYRLYSTSDLELKMFFKFRTLALVPTSVTSQFIDVGERFKSGFSVDICEHVIR